jgi:hypothetical protein
MNYFHVTGNFFHASTIEYSMLAIYTIPSENWDDDFEFKPSQTKHPNDTKHTNEYLPNHMSIASSDWDAPHDDEDEDMKPPNILGDMKNLTH